MLDRVTSAATGLLHRLRPASFRGVAFGVAGGGKDLGRRVITHKFPLRETVMHEDLGRRERIITVDGFLVGVDLATRMRRMEAALETPGPGRLVHPHYGDIDVVVTGARIAAGAPDLATLTITCEIHDGDAQPAGLIDTGALVERLGLAAIADLLADYTGALALLDVAAWVPELLGEVVGIAAGVLGDIAALFGLAGQVGPAVSRLPGARSQTGAGVAIAEAIDAFVPVAPVAERAAPAGVPAIDALLRIAGDGVPVAAPGWGANTSGLLAATANAQAVDVYVRALAAAGAARAAAPVVWNSRDQAIAQRDRIADALADAADRVSDRGWAASRRALGALRVAWVARVTSSAAPLPRLGTVTPEAGTSSILLAFRLDGDAPDTLFARAEDIVLRNQVSHPGFLPASAPLEVLSDG